MTREVMAQPRDRPASACTWPACRPAARWRRSSATTYPDLYAAVGVHSGLAAGAATRPALGAGRDDEAAAPPARPAARRAPTIVFHGDADATVHPANGEQVVAASAGTRPPRGRNAARSADGGAQLHAQRPPRRAMAAWWPSTGWFTARPTPGRAAARKAPTPTAAGRTRPRRCCASSSSIRGRVRCSDARAQALHGTRRRLWSESSEVQYSSPGGSAERVRSFLRPRHRGGLRSSHALALAGMCGFPTRCPIEPETTDHDLR